MSETKSKIVRYEKNPFMEDMVIPTKKSPVKLSRLGKDSNVLVNRETGEENGTHVVTYRKVDSAQFVKLFATNIALTFDLKTAGIKAFNVVMWTLQNRAISKDLIPLDKFTLDEFLKNHQGREPAVKLSIATFGRGLSELEHAQIIAKHVRQGWYFINPNFAFNGDRIAFTTLIERDDGAGEDQLSFAGV